MQPTLTIWPDMGIYNGPSYATERHSHFYSQLVIGANGPVSLIGRDGVERTFEVAYIPSGVSHQTVRSDDEFTLVLLDPIQCSQSLWNDVVLPKMHPAKEVAHRLTKEDLRQLRSRVTGSDQRVRDDVLTIMHRYRQQANAAALDTRISRAVELLQQTSDNLPLSLAAAEAGLSTDRFRHLFREQTGISFSGYRLWQKTRQAILALEEHTQFGDAAHRAGFSDQAHFNRVFRRAFGLRPAELFKNGFRVNFFL